MKNVLLIGLGRFGRHLAEELNQLGHQVMAVDKNEERVDACMDFVTNAQIGDSTAEDFLRSLGVKNYDIYYVTISDNFLSALETTSQLRSLVQNVSFPERNRSCRQNFCCVTGQIM